MNINKLLNPNKICIVGASEKEGFGGDTCRNVIKYMDENRYFLVNPKRSQIFGKTAYPSISDVSENFDLVVICTPQSTVEGILRDAAKKGAGGAVIYASGYKEVGTEEGKEAQISLNKLCNELDIALMGPNCAGFINFIHDIYPFAFLSEDRNRKGAVGFISQSGQLCLSLMDSPCMKFSYSISSGNCAVIEMEDYMEFLIDDESTKVVAIYLEGVNNPKKFTDCLRNAAIKRKPVVVLKAGKSEKGSKVAASHTGSLSGADKIFDALFDKFGVIRVNDLEELLYTAQMLATLDKLPENSNFASMNLSGGETCMCADVGSLHNISYPNFSTKTMKKLNDLLPSYANPANPLDMTATLSYDTDKYAEALRTVMSDENIGMVLIGYTLLEEIQDPAIKYMAQAMEIVSKEPNAKPMAMIPFLGNTRNVEYSAILEKCNIPILPPPVYTFQILSYLAKFVDYDVKNKNLSLSIPTRQRTSERYSLGEYAGKGLIHTYGVPVPQEDIAINKQNALQIAKDIGYPVVMKIASEDILHKSDVGCIKLNISNDEEVLSTYDLIISNAKKHFPNANIMGIIIQKMVDVGTEIIIGVNSDPQFGPAILCGMGGIFVEIFKDTSLVLAPITREEAKDMVESLKSVKLLKGYRGDEPCDIEALIDVIMSISDMAESMKDTLIEVDLNPIFVYKKGTCCVDAVVITDTPIQQSDLHDKP